MYGSKRIEKKKMDGYDKGVVGLGMIYDLNHLFFLHQLYCNRI